MTETSAIVTPGQPLTPSEKIGLELVSRLQSGRDVVLAIDLTESVGLNDEGSIRIRQIVEDSIKPGDLVYVVPFGKDVVLGELTPSINPLGTPIKFINTTKENIDKVLEKIPFASNPNLYGTDIQQAELTIYQGIAQINQNRLRQSQSIKPQSVVWVTDAPLGTAPGITSEKWVETPANSPFRNATTQESQQRLAWIKALPSLHRALIIKTNKNKEYKLTVVDIAPTVQEFCTPAPGNQETCLVTPYLLKQLWLPCLILLLSLAALMFGGIKFLRLRKKWELIVDFKATENPEDQRCWLPNNKRIAIGEYDDTCVDSIDCPGPEVRAYLERKGEKLYLVPTHEDPIYYQGKEITSSTIISSSLFTIDCPFKNRDYEIVIKVKK